MVLLEEAEYERLQRKADEWEPLLPVPLPSGNYPALEYLRASLARKIIRQRRRAGLTQVELARRAGIRPRFTRFTISISLDKFIKGEILTAWQLSRSRRKRKSKPTSCRPPSMPA